MKKTVQIPEDKTLQIFSFPGQDYKLDLIPAISIHAETMELAQQKWEEFAEDYRKKLYATYGE